MNQGWVIEHQCPQCGAPVTLEETDHILSCAYCRVRLYCAAADFFRYCLVPSDVRESDIVFAPYWRLRGMEYFCIPYEIKNRVVDASISATKHAFIPPSLGLRPQALKLRFASPETAARFIKPQVPFKDIFAHIEEHDDSRADTVFCREFIGETISLIYAPFFLKQGGIYDAIVHGELAANIREEAFAFDDHKNWKVLFVSTLCPDCGWALEGEKESCVLFCTNCDSAWHASGPGFKKLPHGVVRGDAETVQYIPFWRMRASIEGVRLQSYADLVRFANLPKAVRPEFTERPVYIWSPAFKVRPNLFLRLSQQLTIFQPEEQTDERLKNLPLYPVTLPLREAAESIRITLFNIATDKRKAYPALSHLRLTVNEYALIYLPFAVAQNENEVIQRQMNFTIDRNALKFGKSI